MQDTEEIPKPHNAADTSRETFIDLVNKGKLVEEKRLIYEAIKEFQPLTSRRLSALTKRERGNVCRSLYDLLHEITPPIKEAFTARCSVTGRRVKWYALIDWKPPVMTQGSLLQEAV